jgi:hypothetical protein
LLFFVELPHFGKMPCGELPSRNADKILSWGKAVPPGRPCGLSGGTFLRKNERKTLKPPLIIALFLTGK